MEELRKKLVDKGLKCERARFPDLLRNRVYISKVLVPAYKDEPEYYVRGMHESFISEQLFFQVQDILDGRSPNRPTKNTLKEQLPLRGHLECRLCGKTFLVVLREAMAASITTIIVPADAPRDLRRRSLTIVSLNSFSPSSPTQ